MHPNKTMHELTVSCESWINNALRKRSFVGRLSSFIPTGKPQWRNELPTSPSRNGCSSELFGYNKTLRHLSSWFLSRMVYSSNIQMEVVSCSSVCQADGGPAGTPIYRYKLMLFQFRSGSICGKHPLITLKNQELLLDHLNKIWIGGLTGREHEVTLVMWLFSWATVLQKIIGLQVHWCSRAQTQASHPSELSISCRQRASERAAGRRRKDGTVTVRRMC